MEIRRGIARIPRFTQDDIPAYVKETLRMLSGEKPPQTVWLAYADYGCYEGARVDDETRIFESEVLARRYAMEKNAGGITAFTVKPFTVERE